MSSTPNKTLSVWLFTICFFVAVLVVFGGYVRLTRSGLSIVEWNVVTGVIPPLNQGAWQVEFAKYQQSPEYQKVNFAISLDEYKAIYFNEYFHRLLGRLAGLLYVVPLFYFLIRGIIPIKRSFPYLAVGLLFALQGAMGWYMVASGLVDRPLVSHYRLTAHLLLALSILAVSFWYGLGNALGFEKVKERVDRAAPSGLAVAVLVVLLIQISYGGLVAGLKAGYLSNTYPRMFGYWIPPGMLSAVKPWLLNLVAAPVTVYFIHRWFAWLVLIFTLGLWYFAWKGAQPRPVRLAAGILVLLVGVQILLGIGVIYYHVPVSLALIHQATALGLFLTVLYVLYQLWRVRAAAIH